MSEKLFSDWVLEMWPEWSLERSIGDRFERFADLLIEWNERMNLTAITGRRDVYVKHFLDSLSLVRCAGFRQSGSLVDVGSGAGFPGIPVALVCPDIHVILCESLKKKANFLRHVVGELGLSNVEVVDERSEDLAGSATWRDQADQVVARAVARLSVLAELCLPLARKGGTWFAMKGPDVQEEVTDARAAFDVLHAKIAMIETLELPEGYGNRTIVVCNKTGLTPTGYPRKAGTANKAPIGGM